MDDGISSKAWNGLPEGASSGSFYGALFEPIAVPMAVLFFETLVMNAWT